MITGLVNTDDVGFAELVERTRSASRRSYERFCTTIGRAYAGHSEQTATSRFSLTRLSYGCSLSSANQTPHAAAQRASPRWARNHSTRALGGLSPRLSAFRTRSFHSR